MNSFGPADQQLLREHANTIWATQLLFQQTDDQSVNKSYSHGVASVNMELRFIIIAILVACVSTNLQASVYEITAYVFNHMDMDPEEKLINKFIISLLLIFVVAIISAVWRPIQYKQ